MALPRKSGFAVCFLASLSIGCSAVHALQPNGGWVLSRPSRSIATKPVLWSYASDDNPSDGPKHNNLLNLLVPHPSCDVTRMSGTDLAYIGDSVFELFVRSRYVWPPKRTSDLQTTVVDCVRGTKMIFEKLRCVSSSGSD